MDQYNQEGLFGTVKEKENRLKDHIERRENLRREQLAAKKEAGTIKTVPPGPNILGYFNTGSQVYEDMTCSNSSSEQLPKKYANYNGHEFKEIIEKIRDTITPFNATSSPTNDDMVSLRQNSHGMKENIYPLGVIGVHVLSSWQIIRECIHDAKEEIKDNDQFNTNFVFVKDIYAKCQEKHRGDDADTHINMSELITAIDFFSKCGEIVYCKLEEENDVSRHLVFFDPGKLMDMIGVVLDSKLHRTLPYSHSSSNILNSRRSVSDIGSPEDLSRSQSESSLSGFNRSVSLSSYSSPGGSFNRIFSFGSDREVDDDRRNGVLRWEEICYTLRDQGYLLTQDESIIRAINQLLESYSVIIPVRESSGLHHKLYIVPSLLNEPNYKPEIHSRTKKDSYFALEYKYGLPIHGNSRCHLEYRFSFPNFVPPGLVQRIMGELYLKNLADKTVDRKMVNQNQCWRNAFWQNLRKYNPQRQGYDSERILVALEKEGTGPMSAPTSVSHLRIIGYGLFVHYPTILHTVTHYTQTVEEILRNYPGLVQREVHVVCPMCVKALKDDSVMHVFPFEELKEFADGESVDCKECGGSIPLDRLIYKGPNSRVAIDPTQSYIQFLEDEVLRLHDQISISARVTYDKSICRIFTVRFTSGERQDLYHIEPINVGTGASAFANHSVEFFFFFLFFYFSQ